MFELFWQEFIAVVLGQSLNIVGHAAITPALKFCCVVQIYSWAQTGHIFQSRRAATSRLPGGFMIMIQRQQTATKITVETKKIDSRSYLAILSPGWGLKPQNKKPHN